MYWLDNDSGVTTPPAIPPVLSVTRQYFTEGGGGDQPSIPGGEWFNMITDEMLAVLAAAGITPNKANHTQLAAALDAMFPNKTTFSASLAVNGYQKLPSGLIIQWGTLTTSPLSGAPTVDVVTFPIAFQTAVRSVTGSFGAGVGSGWLTHTCETSGLTTFTLRAAAQASMSGVPFRWIAIGN